MNKDGMKKGFLKLNFPFADKILFEALSKVMDSKLVDGILLQTGTVEKRKRMLPARIVVFLVIAMTLFAKKSLPEVLNILVEGLRIQGAYLLGAALPVKSALSQARQRLGVKPLVALFRVLAHPIARLDQAWAFYKGLRLMAIDGTSLALPDTPENERFFGRPGAGRGKAAWPVASVIALIEIGTRLTVDAFVGRYKTSEQSAAVRLMRSLTTGMLLMWDRAFVGYTLWNEALKHGAHLLGRLKSNMIFKPIQTLAGGSFLAKLYPNPYSRKKDQGGILVRIIEYTITNPSLPGFGEKHRFITSLLNAELYPAKELIVLYHERWEIELEFDEIKTHMIGKTPTLRSKTPLGVLQEIYGLLIAHMTVRTLMAEAASKWDLDPDRLSFTGALQVISRAIPRMQAAKTELLPIVYDMMLDEIASQLNPPRRNRINPRVIKQKMSHFKCKRQEHYKIRQPQTSFQEAIYVLNPTFRTSGL